MSKIDVRAVPFRELGGYPAEFAAPVAGRMRKQLGDLVGLSQFGVNLVKLPPGTSSSLRHWHEQQDEFVFVLRGVLTLVEDDGETTLGEGDAAGWPAGIANGHHLINRSKDDAWYLEVGSRILPERAHFSDEDLIAEAGENGVCFTRRDGTPLAQSGRAAEPQPSEQ